MGRTTGQYKCFTDKTYTYLDKEVAVPVSIDFEHSQIHNGDTYFYSEYSTALALGNIDFVLEVGAKEIHYIFSVSSDQGGFAFATYEGVTVTAGTGVIQTVHNEDRNSSNVATAILKLNPTVATITTERRLRNNYAGVGGTPSSKIGGSVTRTAEVI